MKKLNKKGFTLIELLAVITIMGILMLVAIPAVSRTIENSRRDTFADVAKTYVNTIRNAILADELECTVSGVSLPSGATPDGTYYYKIDSASQNTKDLMESGGVSSWASANVTGYVKWIKTTSAASGKEEKTNTDYYVYLVDQGNHGILESWNATTKVETPVEEKKIGRSKVSTKVEYGYSKYVASVGATTTAKPSDSGAIECTLR